MFKEITQSSKFLQSVLDGIEDSIKIVDKEFNIIFLNEKAVKKNGGKEKGTIGKKCYEEFWSNKEPCSHCNTWKCFESNKPQRSTSIYEYNGEKQYLEFFCYPIKNDTGKTIYVIEFERDITERKKLEQDKEAHRVELSDRVKELKLAYKELQSMQGQLLQAEKLASIGQITSCLAHEIDSPLTTISGYCELLEEDLKDEKALSRLNIISDQVLRCQKTTREVLDFARKSRNIKTLQDINKLIEKTLSLMEYVLKVNKIKFSLNLNSEMPKVYIDENQVQQVFFNLLNNSVDAMPHGGEIKISTLFKKDKYSLVVSFDDTGNGIPDSNLDRIFEPFFTTKGPGKGTGLGLNICSDIIKNHGGDIVAENSLGKGASFIITLPVNKGPTHEFEEETAYC